jgi:hypothetical protein
MLGVDQHENNTTMIHLLQAMKHYETDSHIYGAPVKHSVKNVHQSLMKRVENILNRTRSLGKTLSEIDTR